MNSFFYYNPTKIEFGKDSVKELANLLDDKHKKVLLHYGGGSIKRSGLYDQVIKILKDKNIQVFELDKVEPNPKLTLVREGIEICRENDITFILAVGGGSVIDSAKVIAAGVEYEGDVWECFTGGSFDTALALGVILTIPATGSESSPNAIVTNEDGMLKKGIEHDSIRPEFAILNPELTLTLPTKQTFAGVVDIISHVHERYFTNTENVELTDGLCESTIRTVISNGYKLKEDPMNYNARAEIMLSGTMAHSGILGLGREEDWGSHRIAHEITALYGTTHGETLSIVLPAWMKYVYKENLSKFVQFAKNIFHVTDKTTDEETALEGIRRFEEFLKDMDMPISFTEAGISTDEFELMAEKATNGGKVGRFKALNKKDVINILELCK